MNLFGGKGKHLREIWERRVWLKRQRRRGSSIHPTVDFSGREGVHRFIQTGEALTVEQQATIHISGEADARLILGRNVYVGRNTNIAVYDRVQIGSDVMIAPYCHINSCNHRFDRRDVPISQQRIIPRPIKIADGVWLGTHVVVLAGVSIGEGAIIGAGSVVTKDVPAWEIWGGCPARRLSTRPA